MISKKYDWLGKLEGLPKIILAVIELGKLNTKEVPGAGNNPVIMALAKEAGVADIYKSDETAWCAVCAVVLALRAGKKVLFKSYERLRAKSFLNFGTPVPEPMLGDFIIFERPGGFHVAVYIAEDPAAFHVAGGNQSNEFNITRIDRDRAIGFRRPAYSIGIPASVKKYFVAASGAVSTNEA